MLFRLFAVLILYVITMGIALPVLPAVALKFGGNGFDVGLLYAIQALGQLIAAPIWGSLSDRIGRRRALILTLSGAACLELATAFCGSLELLFFVRFVAGLVGGAVVVGSSYAADVTTEENRSKGMAVVGISFGLGFTIGPAVGAITAGIGGNDISPFSLGLPFLIAAGCAVAGAIAAAVLIRDVATPKSSSARRPSFEDVRELWNITALRWMFIIFFFYTFCASIMEGAFFLYMNHQYEFSQQEVGYVFAGLGVLTALTQGVVGRVAKRIGERTMVLSGGFVVGASLIVAPLLKPLVLFIAMMSGTTVGRAFVHPGVLALTSRASPSETETGRVMGTLQSFSSFGRVIGPATGGFCFNYVSPESPFILAGSVFIVILFIWLFRGQTDG